MIVDRGYLDHWKTHMLRQLTGQANAAELPLRLWGYCEWKRDDFIAGTEHVIAGICRAQMEPKALVKALLDCRWIDKARGGYVVHGWRERNASWLRKIEGGKMRSASARRGKNGQLESVSPEATGQEASSTGHASSQLAGTTAGAVEWSGVEKSREEPTTNPTRTPARAPACVREGDFSSLGVLSGTWSRILTVLGKEKRRAGREAEDALARIAGDLPVPEGRWEVLAWFYALPKDEKDIDLRSRYRDADKLAINLFNAIERAEHYAQLHGGPQKKAAPKKDAPEPEGWRAAAEQEFPGAELPQSWDELCALGDSVRDRVQRRLEGGLAA